jgi:hypothetical protein
VNGGNHAAATSNPSTSLLRAPNKGCVEILGGAVVKWQESKLESKYNTNSWDAHRSIQIEKVSEEGWQDAHDVCRMAAVSRNSCNESWQRAQI